MSHRFAALAGLLCLISTTPIFAQESVAPAAAERGRHSIVVDIDGGPQIGFWARQGTRTDLGLELGVTAQVSEANRHLSVSATPAMKRYLASTGPLAPYLFLGVPLAYSRNDHDNVGVPDDSQQGVAVGGIAGMGLEWFPVSRVSIGAHVGLQGRYMHWEGGPDATVQLGTTSSGARVHLYF